MKRRLKSFDDVRKAQAGDYNLFCEGKLTDEQARTRGYLLNQIRQTVLSQEGSAAETMHNQELEDYKREQSAKEVVSLNEFKRRFPIDDDLPPKPISIVRKS